MAKDFYFLKLCDLRKETWYMLLRNKPNGDALVATLIELAWSTMSDELEYTFMGDGESLAEELAIVVGRDVKTVEELLEFCIRRGVIEMVDENSVRICPKFIGQDLRTANAERQQRYRDREKEKNGNTNALQNNGEALQNNGEALNRNTIQNKSLEKENRNYSNIRVLRLPDGKVRLVCDGVWDEEEALRVVKEYVEDTSTEEAIENAQIHRENYEIIVKDYPRKDKKELGFLYYVGMAVFGVYLSNGRSSGEENCTPEQVYSAVRSYMKTKNEDTPIDKYCALDTLFRTKVAEYAVVSPSNSQSNASHEETPFDSVDSYDYQEHTTNQTSLDANKERLENENMEETKKRVERHMNEVEEKEKHAIEQAKAFEAECKRLGYKVRELDYENLKDNRLSTFGWFVNHYGFDSVIKWAKRAISGEEPTCEEESKDQCLRGLNSALRGELNAFEIAHLAYSWKPKDTQNTN